MSCAQSKELFLNVPYTRNPRGIVLLFKKKLGAICTGCSWNFVLHQNKGCVLIEGPYSKTQPFFDVNKTQGTTWLVTLYNPYELWLDSYN